MKFWWNNNLLAVNYRIPAANVNFEFHYWFLKMRLHVVQRMANVVLQNFARCKYVVVGRYQITRNNNIMPQYFSEYCIVEE